MKTRWKVAATMAAALLAKTPAFADVKAVVSLECDPDTDAVLHFQASSGSPMTSVPDKCTSAMKALDDANFKVKQVLVKVSATTIDESPASTGGGSSSLINLGPAPAAGTSGPSHSNYLYVFYLD